MRSCGDAPLVRYHLSRVKMVSSINNKYLEFDGISVDLRHVAFSADGLNDTEYIIFLNVCRAMYTNFKVFCDLSLESLAELLYNECIVCGGGDGGEKKSLGECVVYNQNDRNKSLIINLYENEQARIIVAKTIYLNETYHKRVSGYVDFENRHNKNYVRPADDKRADLDREYEIKLLEFT
ncbi:Unknown (Ac57) [Spodoptera exigua multiple nucleopolyhedrovirus]|nr:Unknown (Ac57) [Spodoptera exigua multiple nucleopolyhedrovirus]CDG73142.1 Unknown (Ac57) [Spodoptera exigua multiple nucleopolyhedrovirus]CDG73280.1 Unknown (Ac57) [Spodoptera exigua multiple nucleopolyhedrovirus]